MTPAAITPAGRSKTAGGGATASRAGATARSGATTARAGATTARAGATTARAGATAAPPASPGHRRKVQRPTAAPRPRRVSGPLKGRTAAPAPPAPPRRRSRRARSAARPASTVSLGARAVTFIRTLPDHPWLDRAVRGRAWIAILGVMLAGIVAMQVEVLKLGASIGRSIQRSTTLQTRNEQLRAAVGSLTDDQRIEALAAKSGMVMPSPDSVGFLAASRGKQVARVLSGIRAPDAGSFLALTTDNGAVTTGAGNDPTAAPSADGSGTATATATAASSTNSSGSATDTSSTGTGTATDTSSTGATATGATATGATATGATATGATADTSSSSTPTDSQTAVAQAATAPTDSQGTTTSAGG
jgi:hypothetical protein